MIEAIGLDWKSASVSERERCAEACSNEKRFMARVMAISGVKGCVLLKTCGRLEVYLDMSSGDGGNQKTYREIADLAGIDPDARSMFHETGRNACQRIMEIASGLQSQVIGEDQIIAQVKSAIVQAREIKTATPHLETLFRLAITAGKEVRTKVRFHTVPMSCAHKAIELAESASETLKGKRALVIGNGEMGRLAAALLVERGCCVAVTLRSMHHGKSTIVPKGCDTASYEDRAHAMEGCDIIVSATRSPHITVSREMIDSLSNPPSLMIDLALPRDIDPSCREIEGMRLLDIDDLVDERPGDNSEEMLQARAIISEKMQDYADWERKRAERLERRKPQAEAGASTEREFMRFPIFIDLSGKRCLVVGAGEVGCRRARTLRDAGAEVLMVAPEAASRPDGVHFEQRTFEESDVQECTLVVAATNDHGVNGDVAAVARAAGIPVSVSDDPDNCDFYFPAICRSDNLVAGIVSDGTHHKLVSRAAVAVRETLGEVDS